MTTATASESRLTPRTWTTLILVGLIGQLAWTVENMYLNVYVYDVITTDPTVIATLVAASAIAATIATMIVGAWSDRVGNRRMFIAVGYVLWGLTTASFGLVKPEAGADTANAIGIAIVTIIVLDCIMSVFGSGANDAAFQAWVSESTVPANRGRVDGVLAIMPLVGMLIVFGLLDSLTVAGEWGTFFAIVGFATSAVGIVAFFLVREAPTAIRNTAGYLPGLIHGLRPSTMRAHPRFYVTLVVVAVLGISAQVYLPYLIIYIRMFLQIESYALVLGSVLILASIISILGGRIIDRIGKLRAIVPATGILIAGLISMVFARDLIAVIVAGTIMMGGMMLAAAAAAASLRDATPRDRIGMAQGMRMIATVMIPMIIGPFIGALVIIGANETYVDLGVTKQVPTPVMFLIAAGIAALVVVPVLILRALPSVPATPTREESLV